MKYIDDTITASATAMVNQAISVIRVSGNDTFNLVNRIFSKDISEQKGYTLKRGYLCDLEQNKVDDVILACFRAPKSFTGEDTIEISCHGGVLLTQKILQILLSVGIRIAEPGEFSKRAFLNHKISLIQAEAINDLIFAENETTLKSAISNLNNKSTQLLEKLADQLLTIIAEINVNIDYPEYDGVDNITSELARARITEFANTIATIYANSKNAQKFKVGINTAIIGKPNVGKSSLLNALIDEDKAIVSDVEGTTRDIVEGRINLGTITLNLIDTAGIRNTENLIESIGIKKSKIVIDQAELIILVLDGSQALTKEDEDLLAMIQNKNYIIAINKIDLGLKLMMDDAIQVSAINHNISNLLDAIKKIFVTNKIDFNQDLILSNVRQLSCLETINSNITKALVELKNQVPIDLVVVYLQNAWNKLLEMQGKSQQIKLIDEIFMRFCLGK